MPGSYISQTDLEDRFGASTIAKWSNLDENDTDADTDRIDRAIAYGEERVENFFRDRQYKVAFTGASRQLVEWCVVYAGYWLFTSRGASTDQQSSEATMLNDLLADVRQQMIETREGVSRLPCEQDDSQPDVPTAVV